ncbi:MAG: hypothetical protein KIS61_09390 [Candidatus Eremiobacteraeota bacterium]|nr:hypothetical protein [Candidatus Eremiobacteraeota bacterium]
MKLWDCWVYRDWDPKNEELQPPDAAEALEAASDPYSADPGLTADQVAAAILEDHVAEEGAFVATTGRVDAAVAIREHGSGKPFRLFTGAVLVIQAQEVAWPAEDAVQAA